MTHDAQSSTDELEGVTPAAEALLKRALGGELSREAALGEGARVDRLWHHLATRIEDAPEQQGAGSTRLRGRGLALLRRQAVPGGGHLGKQFLRGWGTIETAIGLVVALVIGLRHTSRESRYRPSHTYVTTNGRIAAITLDDGSRVTLAPNTTLTVNAVVGAGPWDRVRARTVTLTGEATFTVEPDRVPFIVQTGAVETRVLGTTFLVRYDSVNAVVRVAVASGKVVMKRENSHPLTIAAGYIGTVTDSAIVTVAPDDRSVVPDWPSGRLIFRKARVSDVLETLSRWYGYQFRITDSTLADQHITTAVRYDTPTQILGTLQRILDINLTVDGNVITLAPRRDTPLPSARRAPMHTFSPWKEVGR